jgi:hypothetical protein
MPILPSTIGTNTKITSTKQPLQFTLLIMKLSITLLSLAAVQVTCSAIQPNTADEACLDSPEDCLKHPTELGIKSSLYDPKGETDSSAESAESHARLAPRKEEDVCPSPGGRGSGLEYDYGCVEGWCWRNCNGPFSFFADRKTWCWLKYEAGNGGWTPCGRWQDCKYSYDKKNAKCAKKKKGCGECGCGC